MPWGFSSILQLRGMGWGSHFQSFCSLKMEISLVCSKLYLEVRTTDLFSIQTFGFVTMNYSVKWRKEWGDNIGYCHSVDDYCLSFSFLVSYQLDSAPTLQVVILCLVSTFKQCRVLWRYLWDSTTGWLAVLPVVLSVSSSCFSATVSGEIFTFWPAHFSSQLHHRDLPDNQLRNAGASEKPLTYSFRLWASTTPDKSITLSCKPTWEARAALPHSAPSGGEQPAAAGQSPHRQPPGHLAGGTELGAPQKTPGE